jgi:hypothetical protein
MANNPAPAVDDAAKAAILKKFQGMTSYAERKPFFDANPSLAEVYCPSNFSAPVPPPPAPAPAPATAETAPPAAQ